MFMSYYCDKEVAVQIRRVIRLAPGVRSRYLRYGTTGVVSALIVALAVGVNAFAGQASVTSQRQAASSARQTLPAWAIGPFSRYSGNPILTAPIVPDSSTSWEWPRTFNPGVVERDGVFHMVYRGSTQDNYSQIGGASSTDGLHFTQVSPGPVITNSLPNETHGIEDPRLYYLNGQYYTFFTGYNGTSVDINEAVSADAVHWQQLGPVITGTKNAAVIASPDSTPVKIAGHYLLYYGETGNVRLAESSDMVHWSTAGAVDLQFPQSYNPYEVCVAVTDYQTTAGGPVQHNIDLFVAGQLMGQGRWFYAISEVEMSGTHPSQELAQLSDAVLAPQAPYETYGYTPHTVFMNTIMFYANRWWMYYGAGDSVVALANAPLR
jgi:predicted GH43/DUF377 family glycosyl hydrolase